MKPNASKPKVGGSYADRLIVAVHEPAVDGRANAAVIEALAEALELRKRSITIVSGETSKRKTITIDISSAEAELVKRISTLRNSI